MPTYLMTWNPRRWPWPTLEEQLRRFADGARVGDRWSCGNTRKVCSGDRLFFLRQGHNPPRGIFASGWATGVPKEGPHWDAERSRRGETVFRVPFYFDALLDPRKPKILPRAALRKDALGK